MALEWPATLYTRGMVSRRNIPARKLTAKQQRFVEEYLVDLCATQAAIRAGYSQKTANRMGSENLSKPVIQAAIQKALKRRSKRTEVTADNVLREYARLAFADITNVVSLTGQSVVVKSLDDLLPEVTAAISEVSETKDGLRVKFHSKTAALEALGRHLGLFNDKLLVKRDLNDLSGEEIDALLAMLDKRGNG